MIPRDFKRAAIARGQEIILSTGAALPDRADSMDDIAGGQAIAGGDFCFARRAAAEFAAFREEARPCGTMDRTVDAAPAEKRRDWRRSQWRQCRGS